MALKKYVVGRIDELGEGEGMIVNVQNRSIGIFKVDGRFYGLMNRCPHMGGELCKGHLVGELTSKGPGDFTYNPATTLLMCPWHGWEYDVRTGQSYLNPKTARARPYKVQVEHGNELTVELDEGTVGLADGERAPVQHGTLPPPRVPDRTPGPYVAETVPITVDGDYIVVNLAPVRSQQAAPETRTEEKA
jgi:3-phenylpropionate/trans-cinnamate dioxygenase ferredoxin subunit